MSDVNHVILIGRLTRDAELKYTTGGMAVCKFSLAIGKKYKKDDQIVEETSFFDITLWGKLGESINQYLTKGKQVAVEGELKQERWYDADGKAHSKVCVTASNVMLLGGGQSGNQSIHSAPPVDPNAPAGFPGGPGSGGVDDVF